MSRIVWRKGSVRFIECVEENFTKAPLPGIFAEHIVLRRLNDSTPRQERSVHLA
jgi:hypothetical protein